MREVRESARRGEGQWPSRAVLAASDADCAGAVALCVAGDHGCDWLAAPGLAATGALVRARSYAH
eukprot:483488-Pleurochrysis_carterae.AAC.4